MTQEELLQQKAQTYEDATPHVGLGPAIFLEGVQYGRKYSSPAIFPSSEQLHEIWLEYYKGTTPGNPVPFIQGLKKGLEMGKYLSPEQEGENKIVAALDRTMLALVKDGNPVPMRDYVLRLEGKILDLEKENRNVKAQSEQEGGWISVETIPTRMRDKYCSETLLITNGMVIATGHYDNAAFGTGYYMHYGFGQVKATHWRYEKDLLPATL